MAGVDVALFELTTGVVETTELDRDTSANADEWRERTLVECERAFVGEDLL